MAQTPRTSRIRLARITDDPGYARVLGQLLTNQRDTTVPTSEQLRDRATVTPADITAALRAAAAAGVPAEHSNPSRALEPLIAAMATRLRKSTQQFLSGDLTPAAWNHQQLTTIKLVQVAAAVLAYGGRASLTPQRLAVIQQAVAQQYQFQAKFLADVVTGRQRRNGRMLTRAGMYAAAARMTAVAVTRRTAYEAGMHYERNVLGPSDDSCDECLQQESLGWVPIGTLSAPGTRTCRSNCQCWIETDPSRHEAASRPSQEGPANV